VIIKIKVEPAEMPSGYFITSSVDFKAKPAGKPPLVVTGYPEIAVTPYPYNDI